MLIATLQNSKVVIMKGDDVSKGHAVWAEWLQDYIALAPEGFEVAEDQSLARVVAEAMDEKLSLYPRRIMRKEDGTVYLAPIFLECHTCKSRDVHIPVTFEMESGIMKPKQGKGQTYCPCCKTEVKVKGHGFDMYDYVDLVERRLTKRKEFRLANDL